MPGAEQGARRALSARPARGPPAAPRARSRRGRCRARGRSPGRSARPRGWPRSAASIVAATSSADAPGRTPILAATRSSSGPRCRVFMWMIDSTPSVPASAASIRRWASRLADSPSSRLLVSMARITATATSRRPIRAVPATSKYWLPVTRLRVTPSSAKARPMRAARSSSRITGSSGCLARRTNVREGRLAADLVGLDDRGAEREGLQHDRDQQHGRGHELLPPLGRLGVTGVDLVPLVVGLVEREQATDGEQHDGHDERVDVALAAEAERVVRAWPPSSPSCRRAAAGPGCRRRPPSGSPRPASRRTRSGRTR